MGPVSPWEPVKSRFSPVRSSSIHSGWSGGCLFFSLKIQPHETASIGQRGWVGWPSSGAAGNHDGTETDMRRGGSGESAFCLGPSQAAPQPARAPRCHHRLTLGPRFRLSSARRGGDAPQPAPHPSTSAGEWQAADPVTAAGAAPFASQSAPSCSGQSRPRPWPLRVREARYSPTRGI